MTETNVLFDLPDLVIRQLVVSDMANNVYLLTSKRTGAQILIDAADDPVAIDELVQSAASDSETPQKVVFIATTHSHWDHVRALAAVAETTGAPTAAGREDATAIESQTGVVTDRLLDHSDKLEVDGMRLKIVHLRGHTPGSIAYVLEPAAKELSDETVPTIIFSGDSLFPGGVGNTERDPARFTSLLNDVEERLFAVYPDDSVVLPGHGAGTTLGAERPSLPQWRERGW